MQKKKYLRGRDLNIVTDYIHFFAELMEKVPFWDEAEAEM